MTDSADPNRDFALEVVVRLHQAGHRALWAGGCVRDFLLGKVPKDYDVATEARPDEVRKLFGHRRTLAVGASFGVIVVRGPKGVADVEVATFRTEGPYLDGRRPESVRFATPEEDAKRRDFTINGMFFDPVNQQVYDYVGGEHDLGAGIVRAIGDPHDRVRED
jgi:tRNA nucleotidyltransferase/poly(A) polymerase